MNFAEALRLVENLLLTKRGKGLSYVKNYVLQSQKM